MRVSSLADLPPARARVLIINVDTYLFTTVAVCSALRNAGDLPVVVLDTTPESTRTDRLERLTEQLPFDLVTGPLRRHGDTLDACFRSTNDEILVLLDSDAEILDSTLVPTLLESFDDPSVFGAGFLQDAGWVRRYGAAPHTVFREERPWMPFAIFRVEHMRRALDAGTSFKAHLVRNDFVYSDLIARILSRRFDSRVLAAQPPVTWLPASVRQRLNGLQLRGLKWARRDYHGHRPNLARHDTGADIMRYCKGEGLVFAGADVSQRDDRVSHYEGATRRTLQGSGDVVSSIEENLVDRLKAEYGVDYAALTA